MKIKKLNVRELVKQSDVVVKHISTDLMVAKHLNKGLRPMTFKKHVVDMGVLESFDIFGSWELHDAL